MGGEKDDGNTGFVTLDRRAVPDRWRAIVDGDEPVVTQVDDGRIALDEVGHTPTSSCSQPSLVAHMLDELDLRPGQRVLEIGTGTGWDAALLRCRVGETGRVVSVEIDSAVADAARAALDDAGYQVEVVAGDGAAGWPTAAPFDRVIATASVGRVPPDWLAQTSPGGIVVTPWSTDYGDGALLTLQRAADGSASGRFGMNPSFMRGHLRNGHLRPRLVRDRLCGCPGAISSCSTMNGTSSDILSSNAGECDAPSPR